MRRTGFKSFDLISGFDVAAPVAPNSALNEVLCLGGNIQNTSESPVLLQAAMCLLCFYWQQSWQHALGRASPSRRAGRASTAGFLHLRASHNWRQILGCEAVLCAAGCSAALDAAGWQQHPLPQAWQSNTTPDIVKCPRAGSNLSTG